MRQPPPFRHRREGALLTAGTAKPPPPGITRPRHPRQPARRAENPVTATTARITARTQVSRHDAGCPILSGIPASRSAFSVSHSVIPIAVTENPVSRTVPGIRATGAAPWYFGPPPKASAALFRTSGTRHHLKGNTKAPPSRRTAALHMYTQAGVTSNLTSLLF